MIVYNEEEIPAEYKQYFTPIELGQEPTFNEFVDNLFAVFKECFRVLKSTGTLWVNIADTYNTTPTGYVGEGAKVGYTKNKDVQEKAGKQRIKQDSIQLKSLMMIPERLVIKLVDAGFVLRNKIIWKKNSMPEPFVDRFTKSYEFIYFFTKRPRYYFKQMKEPLSKETIKDLKRRKNMGYYKENGSDSKYFKNDIYGMTKKTRDQFIDLESGMKNMRDVWEINTKPFNSKKEVGVDIEHYAAFPPEIPRRCIEAGCPEKVCKQCGQPVFYKKVSVGWIDDPDVKGVKINDAKPYAVKEREGFVGVRDLPLLEELREYLNKYRKEKGFTVKEVEKIFGNQAPHHWFSGESYPSKEDWLKLKEILGLDDTYDKQMTEVSYKPAEKLASKYKTVEVACSCNAGYEPGVVLDPFAGSGNTLYVAEKMNRRWIGIELNPEYCELIKLRMNKLEPTLF